MLSFEQAAIAHIVNGVDVANQDRRARTAVDLALITLLVEAGLTTFGKAAQRIVEIQAGLSEPYQAPAVGRQLDAIVQWLRQQPSGWTPTVMKGEPDPAPPKDVPQF